MSLSPSAIRAMRAAGLSSDQILDVIERAAEERLAKVREGNRIRQAAFQARKNAATVETAPNVDNASNVDNATNAVSDVISVIPVSEGEPSRTCSITNLPSEDISSITPLPPKAEKRSIRNRGTRIPLDFRPSEDCLSFAYGLGFSADLEQRTCAEFVDYWIGVPGARGCKLDWPATYRNRLREVAGRMKLRPGGAAVLPFGGHAPPVRNAPASDEEILAFTLEFNKRQQAS